MDGGEQGDALFRALQVAERERRYFEDRAGKLELEVADCQRAHERAREDFERLHAERGRHLGELANAQNALNAVRELYVQLSGPQPGDDNPNLGPITCDERLRCAKLLGSALGEVR
jgi:hypothetical protein